MLETYLKSMGSAFFSTRKPVLKEDVLPEELNISASFVEKRRVEFISGRFCARKALETFGLRDYIIKIGKNRAPVWPDGYTGSITHSENFAAAAVIPIGKITSLGIDSAFLKRNINPDELSRLIFREDELCYLESQDNDRLFLFHLVFSIKESVFKCLAPLTGGYFGFQDARVTVLDFNKGEFEAKLQKDLSASFQTGFCLKGKFFRDEPFLHTCILLFAESNS